MFDLLEDLAAAWRTILHVSEWSGLSIAMLVLLALGFLYVPRLRKAMLIGAAFVALGWLCLIHGDRVGRADVEAQWADARQAAIEASDHRDVMTELNLRSEYGPQNAAIEQRAADNKKRADDAEHRNRELLAKLASRGKTGAQAASACKLGHVASRLHRPQG
jgi:hypothetical protein